MTRTPLPERNLDLLRAIAVLAVFANHAANSILGHDSLIAEWVGQAGVQAFFVHTSLVLMGSMEKDGAPESRGWIRRFYVRRLWRIYPLAIVVIAIALFLHVTPGTIHPRQELFSTADIATNFLLVQDLFHTKNVLGVLWTLPLELRMYAVLPLCFLVARRRNAFPMIAMLAAGAAGAILYTVGSESIPLVWRLRVLEFGPCFLSGVLAYWLLRCGRTPRVSSKLWIVIIAADFLLGYLAWSAWYETWFVRAAFCAALGVTIPLVADLPMSRVTAAAHTIATYSYGIYLLHPIALWLGFTVLSEVPLAAKLLTVAVTLPLGCRAAYHLVEKPGIDIGRRVTHQRATRAIEPAAP